MDWPTLREEQKAFIREFIGNYTEAELRRSLKAHRFGMVMDQYFIEAINSRLAAIANRKKQKKEAK